MPDSNGRKLQIVRNRILARTATLRSEACKANERERARSERRSKLCERVTRSYATSDWNRGSASSSTLTGNNAAILLPAGRNGGSMRAGIRKRIRPRLEQLASLAPVRFSQDVASGRYLVVSE